MKGPKLLIAFVCTAKRFAITFLFTFACNVKSFAIAILVFFSLFLLQVPFSGRTGKSFFSYFHQLLLQTCVTKIVSPSLDKPANYCALEINKNDGLKRGHVESCPSTTKNIISPLLQSLWTPNFA